MKVRYAMAILTSVAIASVVLYLMIVAQFKPRVWFLFVAPFAGFGPPYMVYRLLDPYVRKGKW